jgi:hypothetical protein
MAEIEIGIMNRQCLNRRIDDREVMRREIAAWELQRNQAESKIHWTFTIETARRKMAKPTRQSKAGEVLARIIHERSAARP